MENKKTISDLNNKAWYRAVKVVYIFSFLAIVIITITLFLAEGEFRVLDVPNSRIVCQYGNEKQFLMKEIFTRDEMPITLPNYSNTQPGGLFSRIAQEQLQNQILKSCEINQVTIENSFKGGKADFVPDPFRAEERYKIQIGYLLLSLLILVVVFEMIRRIFYYIFLGNIKPQK